MEFNFEKNTPKEETPAELEVQLSEEQKQLKFEEECIAESEKLGVSIQELKKEIGKIQMMDF